MNKRSAIPLNDVNNSFPSRQGDFPGVIPSQQGKLQFDGPSRSACNRTIARSGGKVGTGVKVRIFVGTFVRIIDGIGNTKTSVGVGVNDSAAGKSVSIDVIVPVGIGFINVQPLRRIKNIPVDIKQNIFFVIIICLIIY
jgi:hypothetical protein